MNAISRISLAILSAIAVYISLSFSFLVWIKMESADKVPVKLIIGCLSLGFGIYIWKNLAEGANSLSAYVLKGAIIIGGIGFLIGFVGPLIFNAGNQGPLLGIFLTGPIGFIVGAVTGLIYWQINIKQHT